MNKQIKLLSIPQEVVISNIYSEEERPTNLFDIDYLKTDVPRLKKDSAFHEKKKKNTKINLGSQMKRNPKHGPKHKTTRPPKPRL
jgi:hypothetical protein